MISQQTKGDRPNGAYPLFPSSIIHLLFIVSNCRIHSVRQIQCFSGVRPSHGEVSYDDILRNQQLYINEKHLHPKASVTPYPSSLNK